MLKNMDKCVCTKCKWKYIKECIEIFLVFFKTGFIAFGGGLAILKIYEEEFVTKRKWLTSEELFDYYTISQITPGIIIINTSAFIGYKLKKQTGIFCSVLGVMIPSIFTITLIAMFLNNILEYEITQNILKGMNVGVSAVLLNLTIDIVRNNAKNVIYLLLTIFGFISMMFFNVPILIIVSIGAIVGIIYGEKNEKFQKTNVSNRNNKSDEEGGKDD